MQKKSLLSLAFSAVMFAGIVACGGETPAENNSENANEEAQTEQTTTEANHENMESDSPAEENAEMLEMAYYCPMKCEGEKVYAEAGSCPICGMDLVEKH